MTMTCLTAKVISNNTAMSPSPRVDPGFSEGGDQNIEVGF